MDKSNGSDRNLYMDVLRIWCCFCIIMLHVSGHLYNGSNLWRFVQVIVRPTLWCFMMISGYFILSRPISNIPRFYYKNIIKLVVPLFIYTFIYQIYYGGLGNISFLGVLSGDLIGRLWYVYSLIALYIFAPFLQKMLFALDNKEIIILLIIMFIFGRITGILALVGIPIGVSTEIIGNCGLFFFVLGYYLSNVKFKSKISILILVGILNTIYGMYAWSNPVLSAGLANLSLQTVLGVIIYKLGAERLFNEKNIKKFFEKKLFSSIILFVSNHTYGIYLIHIFIFNLFTQYGIMNLDSSMKSKYYVLPIKCICIFIISFICSIVIDFLICKPIIKVFTIIGSFDATFIKLKIKNLEETHPSIIQFVKFGIVGVSNTVISYLLYVGSLLLLQHFAIFPKADYLISQVIAFILSVLWSFYWNNKKVFVKEEGQERVWWKALIKTYISYSFTGLFLNSILLVLWVQTLNISEFIAPIINLCISVPLNFLINKFWAFK